MDLSNLTVPDGWTLTDPPSRWGDDVVATLRRSDHPFCVVFARHQGEYYIDHGEMGAPKLRPYEREDVSRAMRDMPWANLQTAIDRTIELLTQ